MNYTLYTNGTGVIGNTTPDIIAEEPQSYSERYNLVVYLVKAIMEQLEQHSFHLTRFGRIAMYCCSMYGITCLFMALLINRILVIASVNNVRWITWKKISTVFLRIIMISSLVYQLRNVFIALNVLKNLGGSSQISWLLNLIPDSMFAYNPANHSDSRYMNTPSDMIMVGPSTDMNWPIFLNFCSLVAVETFSLTIFGEKPFTELGITIFEHSLAYQEFCGSSGIFFSRFQTSRKGHERPTEQLLIISLLSILAHLNVHIGSVLNGNKYRLVPLTILGLLHIFYFGMNIFNRRLLEFPWILIITTLPQIGVVGVILLCLTIFGFASVCSGKIGDLNYANFLLPFGERTGITLDSDFYSALITLGNLAVSLAGKSSYIKEISLVVMSGSTWVDSNQLATPKGYANFIHSPPVNEVVTSTSSLIRRYVGMREVTLDLLDLIFSLVKNRFRKSESQQIPEFLRKHTTIGDRIGISIDHLSEDDLEERYLEILAGGDLTEKDTSEDYKMSLLYEDEESDIEDETEIMGELFNGTEFIQLVNSGTKILQHHMTGRITRLMYKALEGKDEGSNLAELIAQLRVTERDEMESSQFDCVICQCNVREIITWPCKCFAICESCRLSLVARGIEGCVCCRRDVEGVSKVFIP